MADNEKTDAPVVEPAPVDPAAEVAAAAAKRQLVLDAHVAEQIALDVKNHEDEPNPAAASESVEVAKTVAESFAEPAAPAESLVESEGATSEVKPAKGGKK